MKTYESPLQEAAERFPQTLLWNDSCGVADLNLALRHGATGATSNPVIVGNVLRKEMADWKDRLNALIHVEMPDATDEEICWALSKEAALKGSNMLLPMFRESGGVKGWQAMQVNPRFYRSTEKTVAHAAELSACPPPTFPLWRSAPIGASPSTVPSASASPRPWPWPRPWSAA